MLKKSELRSKERTMIVLELLTVLIIQTKYLTPKVKRGTVCIGFRLRSPGPKAGYHGRGTEEKQLMARQAKSRRHTAAINGAGVSKPAFLFHASLGIRPLIPAPDP